MPFAHARSAAPVLLAATLLAALSLPPPAGAAESYDNCSGYIASVPATITTQGVWCMDRNLSTAVAAGTALWIQANNVTIDCNDFKLGGLAAGDDSSMMGIRADDRRNITIRNCNIRGFATGISLSGGGHLVEDNRLDHNLRYGIAVAGDDNRIQRNAVLDTVGFGAGSFAVGLVASADIIDNTVDGVAGTGASAGATGIQANGTGALVRGNRVRGVAPAGPALAIGISALDDAAVVANRISASAATAGTGIQGTGTDATFCGGNSVTGFATAISNCQNAGGNIGY